MEQEIYAFLDYRDYLHAWLASQPKKGRGLRAALALAVHSPVSHVSQVLNGISDFSFEQAEDANDFLGHTTEQADYFLLLVQFARAGTPKLKARIKALILRAQEKRFVLKDRLKVKHSITSESQALFYSSWHYTAIHILLTIPQYQTKEAIAKYLKISLKKTSEMIEFLVGLGLAELKDGRYCVGEARIHLGSDSPMISKHHINWRLQSIRSLEAERSKDDLHYSSVISISTEDVDRIKSVLVKAIENSKAIIKESKEEELHSLCLDFFKV